MIVTHGCSFTRYGWPCWPKFVEWFTDQDDNAKAVRYQGVSYPTRLEPKFDTVSCTYEYETDVDLPDSPEPGVDTGEEFLRINITGAYPSYHCLVSFDVTSFGTVPIHLTEPALSPDSETEDWVATKVCFQHVMPPQEHMPTDLVVWYRDAPGQTCNPNPKSDLKTLSAIGPVTTFPGPCQEKEKERNKRWLE